MENPNRCMSIKPAKLIVNAHKHNLLKSFCNNGYFCVKQQENNGKFAKNQDRQTDRQTGRQAGRQTHRENALMPVTGWMCHSIAKRQ